MSKILIENMSFYYAKYFNPVFEGVDLNLDTDWKLGLIGRNGRGKTTFLRLLMNELLPVSGSILSDTKMEYFPYKYENRYIFSMDVLKEIIGGFKTKEIMMETLLSDPTDDKLQEYGELQGVYDEAGGYLMEGKIRKELNLMGLSEELLDREFLKLSGGEKTKLLLIALFLRPNRFILMDEPTNHLDIRGKEEVADYLKQKSGFLVVTHDRELLDQVADHILSINKTDITLEKGNYSTWRSNTDKVETFEFRTRTNLEKEISKLENGSVKKRDWAEKAESEKNPYATHNRGNGSRAAKFMRQAKTAETEISDSIEAKKQLLKNYETVPELTFIGQHPETDKEESELLLELDKLSYGYNESIILKNFSLKVSTGDRIWIRGKNGAGKSTLLKLICGEIANDKVKYQENIDIGYSGQEPCWKSGFARDKISDNDRWGLFLKICEVLDIKDEMLKRPIESYSSGEQKKIDIARALSKKNNLLLLDEPLNYMDIYFREQLEAAILKFKPTLVFVEHDEMFGDHVATKTIDLDLLQQAKSEQLN